MSTTRFSHKKNWGVGPPCPLNNIIFQDQLPPLNIGVSRKLNRWNYLVLKLHYVAILYIFGKHVQLQKKTMYQTCVICRHADIHFPASDLDYTWHPNFHLLGVPSQCCISQKVTLKIRPKLHSHSTYPFSVLQWLSGIFLENFEKKIL